MRATREQWQGAKEIQGESGSQWEGVTSWLLKLWQQHTARPARLALLERIVLGPKQTLALVEADGARFLVACSAEGTPAFYALADEMPVDSEAETTGDLGRSGRASLLRAENRPKALQRGRIPESVAARIQETPRVVAVRTGRISW